MPATAGMTRRAMQFGLLPSPTGDSRIAPTGTLVYFLGPAVLPTPGDKGQGYVSPSRLSAGDVGQVVVGVVGPFTRLRWEL